jgi:hypothetical protein
MSSSINKSFTVVMLFAFAVACLLTAQKIPTTALIPSGSSVQVGVVRQVAQTASITTTTIFTVGANTAPFEILGSVYCNTAVSTATVALVITYTDPSSTVQTIAPTAAACTTLGAASLANINAAVTAKNGTLIRYSTTVVSTPNYDVRVQVKQEGTN